MPIVLTDILDPRQIALRLRSRRKANVLTEMVGLFGKTQCILRLSDFLAQVLAREEKSSTLTENGVAFPHARTDLVDHIALAIGRSRAGVPWNERGERARLIFLLAVPQRLLNDYLVLVGMLARITQNEQHREALLAAATPPEFIAVLVDSL
jgi:mannitol/fructose-specific phosphotransferase system IIA component (Ntr-type)